MPSTVAKTMPISTAPLTWRTMRTMVTTKPRTKTRIGHPFSDPPTPNWTGVPSPGRTKPALTKPIRARNKPTPTPIALFSEAGTALKTAFRNPEKTSSSMMTPSITTRPITSAQVIMGAST